MGSEIVGIQAVTSILDRAIEKGHTKNTTPIVLHTDSDEFAVELESSLRRLHPRGVYLLVAGKGSKLLRNVPKAIQVKDPSEETVGAALKQIEQNVTKKEESNGN
jgi:hypothetical protein